MPASPAVVDWLLDSDPAIRWQVMRDLLDAPEPDVAGGTGAGRARGLGRPAAGAPGPGRAMGGRRLLRRARSTAAGAGGVGQPWTATSWALAAAARVRPRPGVGRAPARGRAGRRERALGGRRAAVLGGRGRGVHQRPHGRRRRLLRRRRRRRSSRGSSASGSRTAAGTASGPTARGGARSPPRSTCSRGCWNSSGRPAARRASPRRADLARNSCSTRSLFRRLATGEPADPDFLRLTHPNRWRYDFLRGARLLPRPPVSADPRLAEADRRAPSPAARRRPLAARPDAARAIWFPVDDAPGEPSRWITLRALRVLRWWDATGSAPERRQP